ncbi:CFI-box-CTERM domain-containing protein, partial [Chloroflexota bacterium]
QYTLAISSSRCGYVNSPGEGVFVYDKGAVVELVANTVGDNPFVKWTGDVSTIADVEDAATSITMNDDYAITATFECGHAMCFIATAAYGTPLAEEIQILREFRDEYLLTDPLGQALVDIYYRVSPPVAEFITEHPGLKSIVRAGLLPVVAMSTMIVNTTATEKTVIVGFVIVAMALTILAIRRRRAQI